MLGLSNRKLLSSQSCTEDNDSEIVGHGRVMKEKDLHVLLLVCGWFWLNRFGYPSFQIVFRLCSFNNHCKAFLLSSFKSTLPILVNFYKFVATWTKLIEISISFLCFLLFCFGLQIFIYFMLVPYLFKTFQFESFNFV